MDARFEVIRERLESLWGDFVRHLPNIAVALLLILLTALLARLVARGVVRLLTRSSLRPSMKDLLSKLVAAGLWVLGFLLAAAVLFPSLTPARIFTVFGVGSVAIGFAFKDVFENFLAGIVILLRDVIEIGDVIEVDGVIGRVERTSIRDTHVRTMDGERVILPNATLFKGRVTVFTDAPLRRVRTLVGIPYAAPIPEARRIVEEATAGCATVATARGIQVFVHAFAASSVDLEIAWWTESTPLGERRSRDEVLTAVKRDLNAAGIEIPFPQRTLTFGEELRVDARRGAE